MNQLFRAAAAGHPLVEPLEARRLMAAAGGETLSSASAPLAAETASATAALIAPRRVYLTGNSMTDGVWYAGLNALLGRDGTPVQLGRQTGPGYVNAYNLNLKPGYFTSGFDPARPTNVNPWGNYVEAFAQGSFTAFTLQLNDRRLFVDNYANGTTPQNQAEVPISIEFMKKFAAKNAGGQVFAYARPVRRTDLTNGVPNGTTFNYSAEYLKTYVDSGAARNSNFITRSFTQQYMTAIRQAQAADATTRPVKPIRLIPVAEAWYNVDQAIKAGKFAGTNIKSMTDFYVDASHPSNAGAYLIALTFYSALTGKDPRGVAPTSHYMNTTLASTKVQQLLQQAVYDAMTYSGYAGWTTPIAASTGSLRMTVFNDLDRDGLRDSGEAAWAGVKVFIDTDNDGVLDVGEKNGTTNTYGQAIFGNLAVGPTYRVRVIPPAGTTTTTANPVVSTVSPGVTRDLRAGLRSTTTSVPAATPGSISGRVFSDDDKDGALDAGEALLAARTVFIDQDNDNILDSSETRTTTDALGSFKFSGLVAGTYRITRVFPAGYRLSTPPATVNLAAGQNFSGVLIGAAKI